MANVIPDVETGNANAAHEGEAAPKASRPPPPRGKMHGN